MNFEVRRLTEIEMFVSTNIRLFAQLLSQVAWRFRYNADTEAMIGALRDELAQDAANAITLQSHNKEKQRLKDFFRNVLEVVAPDVTQAEREDQERLSCMTTCSPLAGEANGSDLVTISISVLGRNDRQVESKVRRSFTFADLACRIIRNQPENPAPDFWCKQRKSSEIKCDNNFIWTYQDQPVPIVEALTVEGSGVEVAVIKDNYIVAVVRRNEIESGKPIVVKGDTRAHARKHLENRLGSRIIQIRRLQNGDDASFVTFNTQNFTTKTCPLFVVVA